MLSNVGAMLVIATSAGVRRHLEGETRMNALESLGPLPADAVCEELTYFAALLDCTEKDVRRLLNGTILYPLVRYADGVPRKWCVGDFFTALQAHEEELLGLLALRKWRRNIDQKMAVERERRPHASPKRKAKVIRLQGTPKKLPEVIVYRKRASR